MRKWILLMSMFLLLAALPVTAQEPEKLAYGQSISGTLSADTRAMNYTFSGSEGDVIYISMYAPIATLLQLTGANGTELASAENNVVIGSLIGPLTLARDGIYTVTATQPDWVDPPGGEFGLVIDQIDAPEPLKLDTDYTSTAATTGAARFYTFTGEAGDLLRYELYGYAMSLQIIPPSGESFVSNGISDDLFQNLLALPESGQYTVVIQTLAPEAVDFDLRFEAVEPLLLTPGTPLTGEITESSPPVFQFESAQGKMWQLAATVTNASYASSMAVYTASDANYSITGDGGSGPGGFPRIEPFITPESGTYYVVLTFDDYTPGDATEEYTMSLVPSTLLSLVPGTAIEGLVSPENGNPVYAYSGKADELIRVTLTRSGNMGWVGLSMRSPQEQLIYITNYGNLRKISYEFTLPEEGIYLFEINNQFYEAAEIPFSLLIEKVE